MKYIFVIFILLSYLSGVSQTLNKDLQAEMVKQFFKSKGKIKIHENIEAWQLKDFEFIMEKSSLGRLNLEEAFYNQFDWKLAKQILQTKDSTWHEVGVPKFIQLLDNNVFNKNIQHSTFNLYQLDKSKMSQMIFWGDYALLKINKAHFPISQGSCRIYYWLFKKETDVWIVYRQMGYSCVY